MTSASAVTPAPATAAVTYPWLAGKTAPPAV